MRVTSCYIALYYYMGFSLLMLRRYTDSVRTMTAVLMYLYRTQVICICVCVCVCVCVYTIYCTGGSTFRGRTSTSSSTSAC